MLGRIAEYERTGGRTARADAATQISPLCIRLALPCFSAPFLESKPTQSGSPRGLEAKPSDKFLVQVTVVAPPCRSAPSADRFLNCVPLRVIVSASASTLA